MAGQTMTDRLLAARHSIAGQGLAKSVCKATTEELIGPKKKHLDCECIHFYVYFSISSTIVSTCTCRYCQGVARESVDRSRAIPALTISRIDPGSAFSRDVTSHIILHKAQPSFQGRTPFRHYLSINYYTTE